MRRRLINLEQTCGACPEQYSGTLETGENIYIRIRWGYGYLEVDNKKVSEIDTDDNWRGVFEEGELKSLFDNANIDYSGFEDYLK